MSPRCLLRLLPVLLLALALPALAWASPTITTDKSDYAPGETAQITGSGWHANEEVTLIVTHTDGTCQCGNGHTPWTVTTDGNGGITTTWFVDPDDSAGSSFKLSAACPHGLSAETTFTDSPWHTVSFATQGLPPGGNITVSGSITEPGKAARPFGITFTIPGPTPDILTPPGTVIAFQFASSVQSGGNTYLKTGSTPASPFTTGEAGGSTTVLLNFVVSHKVRFAAEGLPDGTPISVEGRSIHPVTGSEGGYFVPFTSPGPSSIRVDARPDSSFSYRWQQGTVTVGGVTYYLTGSSPASPFTIGEGGGPTTVTATYTPPTPPTLSCPGNMTRNSDPGTCGASVTFSVSASGTPAPSVVCKIADTVITSGHTFPVGTTTVNCTATNSAGSDSCSFQVTVLDNQKPTLSGCPTSAFTVYADGNGQGTVPNVLDGVSAADTCDSSVTLSQSPAAGATISGSGAHTVTISATDNAGNADTCSVTVNLVDNTPPTLSGCPTSVTVYSNGSCQGTVPNLLVGVTAKDNCDPSVTLGQSPASGATLSSLGAHTVTITATDDSGNVDSRSVTVTVVSGYSVTLLYDTSKAYKKGGAVPIKLQVRDCSGANVSSSSLAVTAIGLVKVDNSASTNTEDSGNANPDSGFRFDASLGPGYIYNLSTKGLDTGTWKLRFKIGSDPTIHEETTFDVK